MSEIPLQAIAQLLGVGCEGELQVSGYQIDSRMVGPGDLFFALKGEKVDGQNYLEEVLQRGAVGAIVRKGCRPVEGLALLEVEDVEAALSFLAKQSLERHPAEILGITGSVGKTTTKEFAAPLLEGRYKVGKSPASFNSKVTFPLNLLNRTGDEKLLVLEMGMSEPGELERLTRIAAPDVALVTKISLAHAMNFPEGLDGIARAKAEIFSQYPKTRVAIIDLELLEYSEIADSIRAEKITFSIKDRSADYYLSFTDGQFRIDERGVRAHQFDLPFKESHLLHDFTAALAAARQFGMKWEEIERQIPKLTLPKMRFEQFESGGIRFINDAYNANPASMRAALENLPEPKEGGKKIAVLGSMKELGPFCQEAHVEIGRLAQKHIDLLLCIGDETLPLSDAFGEAKKPFEHFSDQPTLKKRLEEIMRPGDVVLLKGSRSMQLEKIVESLHATSAG